jgi:phage-related baseplate assembly protein
MAGFVRKRFADIFQRMLDWITTYSTALTEFNEGGSLRTLGEAVSWVIEDLYEDLFLGFREMVRLFIYRLFDFARKRSLKSSTSIRFSANIAVVGSDVVIPIGSVVETSDSIQFETTETATISVGNTDSNIVNAAALEGGASGNVPVSTVTRMVTDVAGVDTLTNTVAATGGQDIESETEQQIRFRKFVTNLARCTVRGLEAGAESVTDVYQAQIVEHPTTKGYLFLYIDDGTGSALPTLITAVQNIIEGDGTASNPGYRAAGTFVDYQAASIVSVSITQHLYLRSGVDATATITAVEAAQAAYINQHRLGIDVIKEQLEKVALENKDVRDIAMSAPAVNTVVADGQVAKAAAIVTTSETFVDA